LERKGRYPEALAQILKVRAGMTNSPYFLEYVGFIYARSGDETNARKCLAELEDWKTRGYAVRTGIAQVHLGLREYDLALDELNEALTQGDTVSGLLKDPTLDDLRPLPRFQSLLQKAGLKNLPP
jgi:predicted Zn-dependent protease